MQNPTWHSVSCVFASPHAMQFQIVGTVQRQGENEPEPVEGVTVVGYDLRTDERTSSAVTDVEGAFRILATIRNADATYAFIVSDCGQVLLDTGWNVTWTPPVPGTPADDVEILLHGASNEAPVFGTVRTAQGQPIGSAEVRLWRVRLDNTTPEQLQPSPTISTDANGQYAFQPISPGLLVYVEAIVTDLVAKSDYRIGGGQIDLVAVPADSPAELRGPAEFDHVKDSIKPFILEIDSDENHFDAVVAALTQEQVAQICARSGVEPEAVALFARAGRIAAQPTQSPYFASALALDFVFALARRGIPMTWEEFLSRCKDFEAEIIAAIAENTVVDRPASFGINFASQRTAVEGFWTSRVKASTALAATSLTDTERGIVAEKYLAIRDDPAAMWAATITALGAGGDAKVAALQDALRLDVVTDGNATLVSAVQAERGTAWNSARELAARPDSYWTAAPKNATSTEAAQIRERLGTAYPTIQVVTELANSDSTLVDLRTFVEANAAYEFSVKPLRLLFAENPTMSPTAPADRAALLAKAEPIERVARIAGETKRRANVVALRAQGYDSALKVVRKGRAPFISQLTAQVGAGEAAAIYDRALQIHSITTGIVSRYAKAFSVGTSGVMGPPSLPSGAAADWSSVFGALDYCACEHCQSVLSPAAYLVDVLQFLRERALSPTRSAFDALEAFDETPARGRRADIADIPLTCANTNTVMPQIDLVNEVLERTVNPTAPPTPDTTLSSAELAVHPERLHVAAYQTLLTPTFPFALPYDLWLDEVRSYLKAMGSSRLAICEATYDPLSTGEVLRERLGLLDVDYTIVRDLGTAPTTPQLWGVDSASPNLATTTLAPVLRVMSRSELSYHDLTRVIATGFVRGSGDIAEIAFVGNGCDLSTATLQGTWSDAMLRRMARFERLRRRTGFAVADLDRVLVYFTRVPVPAEYDSISDDALKALSTVRFLATTTSRSVAEVISWQIGLDLRQEDDGSSQYERIFVDPARAATHPLRLNGTRTELQEGTHKIYEPGRATIAPWAPATAYTVGNKVKNAGSIYVCATAGTSAALPATGPTGRGTGIGDGGCVWNFSSTADLSDATPELTRALGLRPEQVLTLTARMLTQQGGTALDANINNLSWLYRYVSVAGAFGLSLESYLLWLDIIGFDPSTWQALAENREERLRPIQEEGAPVEEVAYLARAADNPLDPTDDEVVSVLAALQTDLRKIADQQEPPAPAAETNQQKLVRLLADAFPVRAGQPDPTAVRALLQSIIEKTATPPWGTAPTESDATAALDLHFPRFMAKSEIAIAKTKLVTGPGFLNVPDDRYAYVLPFLAAASRYQQSVAAVIDAIAAATNASPTLASTILSSVVHEEASITKPAIESFLAVRDLADVKDSTVLQQQRTVTTFRRIHKLVVAANRFAVRGDDLVKVVGAVDFDAIPARNAARSTTSLNFVQPSPGNTVPVTVSTTAWIGVGQRLYVAGGGHYTISSITSATVVVLQNNGGSQSAASGATIASGATVQSAIATDKEPWRTLKDIGGWQKRSAGKLLDIVLSSFASPGPTVATLITQTAEATGISVDDLTYLARPEVFNFDAANKLAEFLGLALKAMNVITPLRIPATTLALWRTWPTSTDTTDRVRAANAAKEAASMRVPQPQRVAALQPMRNGIRERQRDALVSRLRAVHPLSANTVMVSVDLLSTELLIDLASTPALQTSRIKQAMSSVQAFVQNAALNNDPEVAFSPDDMKPWQWMKNYRVWEANRKVFLWPENWIEPELRDDKTEFFRELETQLLQDELTEENVEAAYLAYLKKLDEVGHLNIAAICSQSKEEVGADTLHVIGATYSEPHKRFWRRRVNGVWEGWQKLDIGIEGRHLLAVVHGRRLHLLWPVIEEKPLAAGVAGREEEKFVASKLAWASWFAGAWSQKQVSTWPLPITGDEAKTSARLPPQVGSDPYRSGVGRLAFWPVKDGDDLFIAIVKDEPDTLVAVTIFEPDADPFKSTTFARSL